MDDNPIDESTKVAYNSFVQLHIYTEALYGQELRVQLFDKDSIGGDDCLSFPDKKGEVVEVRVIEATPREEAKKDEFCIGNFSNNKKLHVQKAVVGVKINLNWKSEAGKLPNSYHLEIYPKIKQHESGKELGIVALKHLNVYEKGTKFEVKPLEASNQMAGIDQIETDIAHFEPCRYEKITLEYPDKTEEILFNPKESLLNNLINICLSTEYVDKRLDYDGWNCKVMVIL